MLRDRITDYAMTIQSIWKTSIPSWSSKENFSSFLF